MIDLARSLALASLVLLAVPGRADEPILQVGPDSSRWDLQGQATVAAYLGRPALRLDGGAAVLKDFSLRDGVIDVDVATEAPRGFFGLQFRLADEGANGEWIYLRPHKTGLPDALQYTPVLRTGAIWQIYNGPGFTGALDIPKGAWFHLRLEVTGAQARLFVEDMDRPALVMDDLKSGVQRGELALHVLTGATYFSHFQVRSLPDHAWTRHPPPMPAATLVDWELSPAFDALARNLEAAPAEAAAWTWQRVAAEPPGFVVVNRYRDAPHPRVTFQGDFSRRMEPQPGMKVVYARTWIQAERPEVRRLSLGYSDEVSVFLNGRILFRGRSAQGFRDPGFLGIVNPENDAVYLPLEQGRNELVLAVAELGGGWGFIARLEPMK